MAATWLAACGTVLLGGCGTVDLGDDIVPPDLQLDEDFFHCEIQPNVLTAKRCAGGDAGEEGSCHADRSALRLQDVPTMPMCEDGVVVGGEIPAESLANYQAVRFTVQSDVLSSPLYRRPTGMDSHPRMIFDTNDDCALLITEWIQRGMP
jgi:hypothetical protein